MTHEQAYIILTDHKNWELGDSKNKELKEALSIAISLLEKHRCGYCDCIMDKKSKNKYGDYGRVCDHCHENLI